MSQTRRQYHSEQIPLGTDPRAVARHYEKKAIKQAGNDEVRDRLLPEVQAKSIATWNLAIDALKQYGRPVLVTEYPRTRANLNREYLPWSTGLIELPGHAGEAGVRTMRLTAFGDRLEKVVDLEEWREGRCGLIRADLYTVRPVAPADRNDPDLLRMSETYLPGPMSRLPKVSLMAGLRLKAPDVEVIAQRLPIDEKVSQASVAALFRPHVILDHWDVETADKVQARVDCESEELSSQVALYSLIGLLGDPLRENPVYKQ